MRVVLDTNVIVASFAARGLCAEIFEVCLTDHTTILSEYILAEVEEKLIGKIHLPRKTVQEIVVYLREHSEIVHPEKIVEPRCRDRKDIPIIGTALSGDAAFLITGDEDLLSIKKYGKVTIVTPRMFWSRCRIK